MCCQAVGYLGTSVRSWLMAPRMKKQSFAVIFVAFHPQPTNQPTVHPTQPRQRLPLPQSPLLVPHTDASFVSGCQHQLLRRPRPTCRYLRGRWEGQRLASSWRLRESSWNGNGIGQTTRNKKAVSLWPAHGRRPRQKVEERRKFAQDSSRTQCSH